MLAIFYVYRGQLRLIRLTSASWFRPYNDISLWLMENELLAESKITACKEAALGHTCLKVHSHKNRARGCSRVESAGGKRNWFNTEKSIINHVVVTFVGIYFGGGLVARTCKCKHEFTFFEASTPPPSESFQLCLSHCSNNSFPFCSLNSSWPNPLRHSSDWKICTCRSRPWSSCSACSHWLLHVFLHLRLCSGRYLVPICHSRVVRYCFPLLIRRYEAKKKEIIPNIFRIHFSILFFKLEENLSFISKCRYKMSKS